MRWQQWRNQSTIFSTIEQRMKQNSFSFWLTADHGDDMHNKMMQHIEKMIQRHPYDIDWVIRNILSNALRSLERSTTYDYDACNKFFTIVLDVPRLSKALTKKQRAEIIHEVVETLSKLKRIHPDTPVLDSFTNKLLTAHVRKYYENEESDIPDSRTHFIKWLYDFDSDYNEYIQLLEVLQPDYDSFLMLLKQYGLGLLQEKSDAVDITNIDNLLCPGGYDL